MNTDKQKQMKLREKLNNFKLEDPSLLCSSSNKITCLCVNNSCQFTAAICGNDQCQSCSAHYLCHSIRFKQITFGLNQMVRRRQQFFSDLCSIENFFIDILHESRKDFPIELGLTLNEQNLSVIDKLYSKSNIGGVVGMQTFELEKLLKEQKQFENKKKEQLLEYYKQHLQTLINSLIYLKKEVYQSFFKNQKIKQKASLKKMKTVEQNKKEPQEAVKVEIPKSIALTPSLIDKLEKDQHQYLLKSLHQPSNIKLIFRASEHEFKASAFHQKCDNIEDTFVIVQTEFGKLIGGYSHYPWNAVNNDYFGNQQKQAFLLSITHKEKYRPQSQHGLIFCYRKYGPVFGIGHDLCIADRCNKFRDSYACFPQTYNFLGTSKLKLSQNSLRLAGVQEGNRFKIDQYEVFQLTFNA